MNISKKLAKYSNDLAKSAANVARLLDDLAHEQPQSDAGPNSDLWQRLTRLRDVCLAIKYRLNDEEDKVRLATLLNHLRDEAIKAKSTVTAIDHRMTQTMAAVDGYFDLVNKFSLGLPELSKESSDDTLQRLVTSWGDKLTDIDNQVAGLIKH